MSEEFNDEFILNEEKLDTIIGMVAGSVEALKEQLKKNEKEIKLTRTTLEEYERRLRSLNDVKLFVQSKGFQVIKMTIDQYAKEFQEAQKERVTFFQDIYTHKICGKVFEKDYDKAVCLRPAGHKGKCAQNLV